MFLLQEQPQHLLKHHQLSTAPLHTTSTTQPPPNSIPTPYLLSPHSLSSPLYPHLPLPLPYLPPHTTIPYLPTTPTSNNHSFHHHSLHLFHLHIPIHLHSFHTSTSQLHPYSLPTPFPHLSIHISHFHHSLHHFHHTLSTNT